MHPINKSSAPQANLQANEKQQLLSLSDETTFILDAVAWGISNNYIKEENFHSPTMEHWREDAKKIKAKLSEFLQKNPNLEKDAKILLQKLLPLFENLPNEINVSNLWTNLTNCNAAADHMIFHLGGTRKHADALHREKWQAWENHLIAENAPKKPPGPVVSPLTKERASTQLRKEKTSDKDREFRKKTVKTPPAKDSSATHQSQATTTQEESQKTVPSALKARATVQPVASTIATANIPPASTNWQGDLPSFVQEGSLSQDQAMIKAQYAILASATATTQEIINAKEQIYNSLQKIYPPINSAVDPSSLPNPPDNLGNCFPSAAVSKNNMVPTNDWAQGAAERAYGLAGTVPLQATPGTSSTSSSVSFFQPSQYTVQTTTSVSNASVPATKVVENVQVPAFTFDSRIGGNYQLSYDDGNLVRTFIQKNPANNTSTRVFMTQGPVWKGAEYTNIPAAISIPGGIAKIDYLPPLQGSNLIRIRIQTKEQPPQTILIAASSQIKNFRQHNPNDNFLFSDSINGTAYVNVAVLPRNPSYPPSSEDVANFEKELWDTSSTLVTKGYAGVNYPGYEYAYQSIDVDTGKPTANDPLIALNLQAQETLCKPVTKDSGKTDLVYQTLSGPTRVVKGSNLQFQEIKPGVATPPKVPDLYFDPSLTSVQKNAIIADLKDKMNQAIAFSLGMDIRPIHGDLRIYESAKFLSAMGKTIEYSTRLMEQQNYTSDQITSTLQPLVNHLKSQFQIYWTYLSYDQKFKGIVDANSPNYRVFNDQLTVTGYVLEAASKLQAFDQKYSPASTWMNQTSGVLNFSNKDMADMICRNTAENTSQDPHFPQNRALDFFSGHSWLHGVAYGGNPRNVESTSECINGDRAARDWLSVTGRADLAQASDVITSMEARTVQAIAQIGNPAQSIYPIDYANNNLVATNISSDNILSTTFFEKTAATAWAKALGIHFIPSDAEMANLLLYKTDATGHRVLNDYGRRASAYIQQNWNNFEKDTNIQSNLIAIVAQDNPEKARLLLQDILTRQTQDRRGYFDTCTNAFILSYVINAAKPS